MPPVAADSRDREVLPDQTLNARGNPGLVKCSACSKDISALATACPGCGAPNMWVHPSITQFLSVKDQTGVAKKFKFWSNKIEIWGETEPSLSWWKVLLFFLLVPGLFAGLLGIIFVTVVYVMVLYVYGKKKQFKANLHTGTWQSNDEKFWQPVRAILKI